MTTAAEGRAFFAEAHWGSRYGVVDQYHATPHKGLDLGLFHGEVAVPALHPGVVVASAASSFVGHYVTVLRADGLFDTYCHIVPSIKIGQSIPQWQTLGRQAETQAEGGTQWKGQHTHLCLSRTRDGWGVWGYVNLDPTPGVIAVLTNTASGGSALLTENEDTMIHWGRNDAGKVTYALGDAEHWEEYTDAARQASDAALYGVYEDITNDTAKKSAWNYRSNTRLDLKKPFGVAASSGGGVTADYFSDSDGVALRQAIVAAMPTKEDIATEIIRQMKLPGN